MSAAAAGLGLAVVASRLRCPVHEPDWFAGYDALATVVDRQR